jgi:hypothetical protein
VVDSTDELGVARAGRPAAVAVDRAKVRERGGRGGAGSKSCRYLEGLELLVEAGDGRGEAVLADVADVPGERRRLVLLLLLLRAGGRSLCLLVPPLLRRRALSLALTLTLTPVSALLLLLLAVLLVVVRLVVVAPRPAVLHSVGLPPHPAALRREGVVAGKWRNGRKERWVGWGGVGGSACEREEYLAG